MPTLYYIHDPMCSWCYAFAPAWEQISRALPAGVRARLVVGGLARDSDEPMSQAMRTYIQATWQRIQTVVPGTEFNFEFWTRCMPRRSTYPACRAVLAARHFSRALEWPMITAIQRAYYREARNPSDTATLNHLAGELGLDETTFERWCASEPCAIELDRQLLKARSLAVGFPSLVLETEHGRRPIPHEFDEPDRAINALQEALTVV